MPQPNQGSPASSAPSPAPVMDKSGAMKDDHIKTGVHTPGVGGSKGSFK
jgi:hypothetical protein